jgi:sterol desaturase/sphingolipid hydroxylase (fatty acid hydroxylase superfamily)
MSTVLTAESTPEQEFGIRPSPELAPPDRSSFRSVIPPTPQRVEHRTGWRRLLAPLTLLTGAGVAAAVYFERLAPVLIVILFVMVVPFEKLFPRHRQRLRRPALGTDLAYALVGTPLSTVGAVVGALIAAVSLFWLPGLALRPLVGLLPELPKLILGLLLFDMVIYWSHRWAHEVPFLWRFHSIHHSTRHLDWISGLRAHPFDGVFLAPAFVMLLAAGFSAEFTGALTVVQFFIGIFSHANVRWRLRPLHKIVFTPEFHHWHHADEPEAINTNYSIFLPLWDLIFGTYYMPADRRPQVYGVSEPIPQGIARQLWHPFRGLRNPLKMVRHPWRSARDVLSMVRRGIGQMVRSARRPRVADRSYTA